MKLYFSSKTRRAPRRRYSRSSAPTSSTAAPARFLSAGMTSSPSTCAFWIILSKGSLRIREWYSVRREGSLAKPTAAVEFAWESQSTRSVGWPAAARQAERFTAVVVFPTPPFWLATAMIRATEPPLFENLAKEGDARKMFHVEQLEGQWKM